MADCCVELKYHCAGQGLFSTGEVFEQPRSSSQPFRWIYDCGSTSGRQKALRDSIDAYARTLPDGEDRLINLVVISHFDRDHINGLVDLLHRVKIHTLLIPLLPVTIRIAILIAENADANSDLAHFILDPAAFVASIQQDYRGVQQILFVPTSDSTPDEREDATMSEGADGSGGLRYPRDSRSSDIVESHGLSTDLRIDQGVIRAHGVLHVRNWWEFIPYNDATTPNLGSELTNQIEALAAKFKVERDKKTRKSILAKLKGIYEARFPTAELRNRISLFLYGGPLNEEKHSSSDWTVVIEGDPYPYPWSRRFTEIHGGCGAKAVIYTGDGYLDTRESLKALRAYWGSNRLQRTLVFQVMHHGARDNWFRGLADEISPYVSIFSSDPDHYFGHPHPEVLRDFWMYNPVQVDCSINVTISFKFKV